MDAFYLQLFIVTFSVCMALVLSLVLLDRFNISLIWDIASQKSSQPIRKLGPFESYIYDLNKQGMEIICYIAFVQSRLPLTVDLVRAAAKVLQRRHPLLRMRVREDGRDPCFIQMEEAAVDVAEVEAANWEDVHAMQMKTDFNLLTGPLWRIRLLGADHDDQQESGIDRNILALSFIHCIADGNCIMRLLNELMDIFTQLSNGDVVDQTSWPLLPPVEDFFQQSKLTLSEKILTYCRSRIGSLLKSKRKEVNQYIQCFPAYIGKNPTVVKETRALSIGLTKEELQKLRENCRKYGATINGATTAAASIAVCKIMQGGRLTRNQQIHTCFMVNMRNFCKPPLEQDKSFGFYCSMLKLDVAVPKNADSRREFWKLAAKCTEQTKRKLTESSKEALRVFKMISVIKNVLRMTALDYCRDAIADQYSGGRSDDIFTMSNLGNCSYLTKDIGRDFELVRKVSATGGFVYQPTFGHYIATLHGKMFWSLAYHTNVCTKTQAQEYANAIEEVLAMIIE
ncbi:uncharacterized protein [Ptychodera flava]